MFHPYMCYDYSQLQKDNIKLQNKDKAHGTMRVLDRQISLQNQ